VSSATWARASTSLRPICSRLVTAFSTAFQRLRARVSASKTIVHFHSDFHLPKLVLPSTGADLPRWARTALDFLLAEAENGAARVIGGRLVYLAATLLVLRSPVGASGFDCPRMVWVPRRSDGDCAGSKLPPAGDPSSDTSTGSRKRSL
jgi:hypothetical protein